MKPLPFCAALLFALPLHADEKKPLRAGIIGLDTSHVEAFTGLLNATKSKPGLAGEIPKKCFTSFNDAVPVLLLVRGECPYLSRMCRFGRDPVLPSQD